MKKTGTNILLAVCALTLASPETSAQTSASDSHREIYGWFLRSGKYGDGHYGYAAINMTDPSDYRFIYKYDMKIGAGQYAGAAADGIYYGCEYTFPNLMEPPVASSFVRYNIFTGIKEDVGEWNSGNNLIDVNFKPLDMTYNYQDNTMYAIGFLLGTTSIYTVNLDNGRFTKTVDLSGNGATLAADGRGELYTITLDGQLCKINKNNGNLVKVFDTGHKIYQMQSMEFDLTTGKLYWALNEDDGTFKSTYELMEIDMADPDNITISKIGTIDEEAGVHALYIPYAEGGLDAPAAPTGITVETAGDGSLNAQISWENPTMTFGGSPLGSPISGVVVFRDGEQIGFVTGSDVTNYTDDKITKIGEYRYDLVAINANGTGAKGTIYAYVGEDSPAPVKNLALTPSAGCGSAVISWDAVKEGYHGGRFSKPEEVTYTVTRKPDNKVVAKDIKETSVTDNQIVRVLKYSYEVKASNEIGASTVTTESNILGPATKIPYEEYFSDKDYVNNNWTQVDANGDGFTWMLDTTLGYQQFGSYDSGFEYATSPTQGIWKDADEWIISPPFKFEAGKEYELAIFFRSKRAETVQLHIGDTNLTGAMGDPISDEIILRDFNEDDYDEIENCIKILTEVVPLPTFDTESVKCFGLHLISPLLIGMDSFLQINGMGIAEKGTYAGIAEVKESALTTTLNGRHLHVDGNATTSIYSISGVEMLRSEASDIDLSNLPAGVYVIHTNTQKNANTFKVVLK